ncbi:3' terminal RNA ribose 2'-O-methyltransferase Hen1 [Nocardia goodfellowii]|uniref:Small RNA 2'-O-methyltransferase n=1 Tax=Nocardia goodfellowii TaxID=882446 RepID=A0ABS4QR31_9NOCA|nr:3' terminal RNA ribose 2'-O-methyltransferase Hen1 [Nocardia goodfellowii]MBP2194159.1 3' terminal RNA ribose 2'-O-methyltransferase Hen1 [Nocardia goodfellowii]
MLLTITCTPPEGAAWPASDLGFLLHKNPSRVQAFEQSYGTAHVLYPEASEQRCTVALLLEVDPIGLVRGRSRNTPDFSLGQYVNDRPYAASSLLSVALGSVFRTALRGRCELRPELAQAALPLRVELPAVPCKGGPEAARKVFAPLGWAVTATALPLDPVFPEWGESHYLRLELTGTMRLADALSHLYVLLPVLDGAKHYWLAADEVDKLIRTASGWLAEHPERAWITRRYLARRQSLVRTALARLAELDDVDPEQLDAVEDTGDAETAQQDAHAATRETENLASTETEARTPSLAVARRAAVRAALGEEGARRVLDLGCGEGVLLRELLSDNMFTEIVGVDVSMRALNIAKRRLRLDRMPERTAQRLTLLQGALTYTDERLRGYDAAVLMEVIEHVDPPRLGALEHAVFGSAAPASVLVTTPNAEINVRFEGLAPGEFRHDDHRFEWTRAEFAAWAAGVAARYGYAVRYVPIGTPDPEFGPPTQMAVFTKPTHNDEKGAA